MLTIKLRVPRERKQTAEVEIRSGLSRIAQGRAVASASTALAARHGNPLGDPLRPWGHPPPGSYVLLAQGATPAGAEAEYGPHLLVFQPMGGAALEAESFGRLLLLVYAGPGGSAGHMRLTKGGVRLQHDLFDKLQLALARDPQALMEIETVNPPAWWQFWRKAAPLAPLAGDEPRFSEAPFDEMSLAELVSGGKRIARRSRLDQDDDWHRSRDRDSSSSSSSGSREYSGQGGTFGGGGASGGWESAAGAVRGVDATGRVMTTTAGAALMAEALDAGGVQDAGSDTAGGAGTGMSTSY